MKYILQDIKKNVSVLFAIVSTALICSPYMPYLLAAGPAHVIQPENSASFHLLMGQLYEDQGNLYMAKREYKQAVMLDPFSPVLHEELIELCYFLKDYPEADLLGKKLLELDPGNSKGLKILGNIQFIQKRFKEAALYYESALKIDNDPFLYIHLANVYEEIGDHKSAEKTYKEAVRIQEKGGEAVLSLANFYENRNNLKKALPLYLRLYRSEPSDLRILIRLGMIYKELGKLDEAKKFFQKAIILNTNDLQACYALVQIGELEGDWTAVGTYLSRIKDFMGKETPLETYLYLSYAYLQQGNTLRATESIEAALMFYPESSDAWYYLGAIYESGGDFLRASTAYQKAAVLEPKNIAANFHLAVCYDRLDRFDQAEGILRNVIQQDPGHSAAYNYLGYSWADRGINLDEAQALIEKALDLEPGNGAYLDSLGWVLFKKGEYAQALKELRRASRKMKDPVIFEHLGDVFKILGENKKAQRNFRKASKMDPDNSALKKKIEDTGGMDQ